MYTEQVAKIVCHCWIMVEKARERCTCICLQGNCGVAMSEAGCVRHMNKSTTHAVESERVENNIVAKENSQDTGNEEKREGMRTSDIGSDIKLGREYSMEPSLNVGIWGWWALTNRKVHSVERINGRGHWVTKRSSCSKGQKSKAKDGKDDMV